MGYHCYYDDDYSFSYNKDVSLHDRSKYNKPSSFGRIRRQLMIYYSRFDEIKIQLIKRKSYNTFRARYSCQSLHANSIINNRRLWHYTIRLHSLSEIKNLTKKKRAKLNSSILNQNKVKRRNKILRDYVI